MAEADPKPTAEQAAAAAEAQAGKAAARDRSHEIVAVACKFPNGIILDLDRYEKVDDRGNVRVIKGKLAPVRLKGWATPHGESIIAPGGYVVTAVPKEFWDQWLRANGEDCDLLRSGMVFAMPSADKASARAKEQAALPAVFGGIRPTKADGVEVATDDRGRPLLESSRALQ